MTVHPIAAIAPARRPAVLAIGNDRVELAAWVEMLRDHGFDAFGAEGGRVALRHAEETPPDVVVLDFRGRPSSGVTATRQIREREDGLATKILIASTMSRTVLAQCLSDYDAFIARPFEPAQLLRAIRELVTVVDRPIATSATPAQGERRIGP